MRLLPNNNGYYSLLLRYFRIKSLHWVTVQHLEANIDDKDLGVRLALDKSIAGRINYEKYGLSK